MAKLKESASLFVPQDRTLPVLAEAVQKCKGCDLYKNATQAVFGDIENGVGATKPKVTIMMIGRPGRQAGKAVCRARGKAAGQGSGRGGDRSRQSLRDKRGEALQVGTAG